MAKGRSLQKELKVNANAGSKEQPDMELRTAVHKLVKHLYNSESRPKIKMHVVAGGETALRLIIAAVETKFERGITDLEEDAQKWTLLACRDICLRQKVNGKLLEKLEYTIGKMGSSYEKAELMNLLDGQWAKKKLPKKRNRGRIPKRPEHSGQRAGKERRMQA